MKRLLKQNLILIQYNNYAGKVLRYFYFLFFLNICIFNHSYNKMCRKKMPIYIEGARPDGRDK